MVLGNTGMFENWLFESHFFATGWAKTACSHRWNVRKPFFRTLHKNSLYCFLFDSGEDDPQRILIFASDDALRDLCRNDFLAGDGTFKISPTIFFQMYIIHCQKEDRTYYAAFVRSLACSLQNFAALAENEAHENFVRVQ